MRLLLVLIALSLLSACATTGNLEELRRATPRGTPYAIALTQHYLAFSEAEARSHDWTDSSYFAEKGLTAGYGQPVMPEMLETWDIPEDMKPELLAAREKLLKLADEGMQEQYPEQAAEATFAFDCWLEELDEGWDKTAISGCQQRFYTALDALEFAATQPKSERIGNTAYLVYFGYDRSQFDDAAAQVVDQVIADATATQPSEIVIHGHTDSSGSESYNMNLSEKRALSVLEALISGGIPAKILNYFAFGETDPAVDRGDNAPEPKNRRVEIFLG